MRPTEPNDAQLLRVIFVVRLGSLLATYPASEWDKAAIFHRPMNGGMRGSFVRVPDCPFTMPFIDIVSAGFRTSQPLTPSDRKARRAWDTVPFPLTFGRVEGLLSPTNGALSASRSSHAAASAHITPPPLDSAIGLGVTRAAERPLTGRRHEHDRRGFASTCRQPGR